MAYDDTIVFNEGETISAEVVGKNSFYIFCVEQGNANVKISPINGTINSLWIKK